MKAKRRKASTRTKAKSQVVHAQRRALERYGLNVNEKTNRQFVNMIQAGKATLLQKQSLRVAKYRIEFEEKTYIVIYDRKRKTIVTFLPDE